MAKRSGGTTTFGIIALIYGFIALWLTIFGAMGIWVIKNNPEFAQAVQLNALDTLSSVIAFTFP